MTTYLECKTLGHAWYHIDTDSSYRPTFGTPIWFACERCPTQRHDIYDRLGRLASRSYVYSEDYKDKKKSRDKLRVELMRMYRGK